MTVKQFGRALIVIGSAIGIIFIPYFIGSIKIISSGEDNVIVKWMMGLFVIVLAFIVVMFLIMLAIKISDYIKGND